MHFFFEREREQSSQLKEYFIILNPLKFQMKDAKNNGHSHKTIASCQLRERD